jgi:hypothetical protein
MMTASRVSPVTDMAGVIPSLIAARLGRTCSWPRSGRSGRYGASPPLGSGLLAAAHDMSWEDVVSEASRKRAERGGFDNRIFLEYVDEAR